VKVVVWCILMGLLGFTAGVLWPGMIVVAIVLLAFGGGFALSRSTNRPARR
jgi:hypothetical protein